jgi:hypothetical protein
MYCGLCKGIGKTCGQKGRFLLSYDLTFLSLFLHNILDKDVKIEKQRCVVHHIVKRPVAIPDELTERIAALNVILAYNKLNDDVLDNGKGRIKRSLFKSSYKKAKRKEPILEQIVDTWYKKLLEYERKNTDSIDMASDPFGQMIAQIVKEIVGDVYSEDLYLLSYNLGKWIYLIDALDDFDKDIKKQNYNVFVNSFKDVKTKEEFIKIHIKEILEIFTQVLMTIEQMSKQIKYKFNHDLIDNILISGLKQQTKLILENKQCKNTTKY